MLVRFYQTFGRGRRVLRTRPFRGSSSAVVRCHGRDVQEQRLRSALRGEGMLKDQTPLARIDIIKAGSTRAAQ